VLSYDLLSKLLLGHRSHNYSSFLSELLFIITLANTNSITRTRQTKHIEDEAEAITVAEVFKEISEAAVTLEAVTVFREEETVGIIY
jgi:hypothetical protein